MITLSYQVTGETTATVLFAADVPSLFAAPTAQEIATATEIVRAKRLNWIRAWADGKFYGGDVAPSITHDKCVVTARMTTVVALDAVRACQKEQAIG